MAEISPVSKPQNVRRVPTYGGVVRLEVFDVEADEYVLEVEADVVFVSEIVAEVDLLDVFVEEREDERVVDADE